MSIKDRIVADLKQAMLQKEELRRDTLRMLKADLLNEEVKLGKDLDDAQAQAVLLRAVKSREDSVAGYVEGGRPEAAEQERREIAIVQGYLPQQLTEAQTRAALEELVAELGLSGKKDMGRLMKELKARHGAAVDGRLASGIAAAVLGA